MSVIGQRYDVLFTANRSDRGPFWIRAIPLNQCSSIWKTATVSGILYYGEYDGTIPKDLEVNSTTNGCTDEPMASLVPIVPKNVPPIPQNAPFLSNRTSCTTGHNCSASAFVIETTINQVKMNGGTDDLFRWLINNNSMTSIWGYPTAEIINNTDSLERYTDWNFYEVPDDHEWVYVMFDNRVKGKGNRQASTPHPMHLHGHDFYILAQGTYPWNESSVQLSNPPRRDSALLPGLGGYLLIAWKANNPGPWLMHCHFGWHTDMGFDMQFIEKRQEFRTSMNPVDWAVYNQTCADFLPFELRNKLLQSVGENQAGV